MEHRMPKPQKCPSCQYQVDASTCFTGSPASPKPGDLTICINCLAVLEFGPELELRKAIPKGQAYATALALAELFKARRPAHSRPTPAGGSSKERLIAALLEAGAPDKMLASARAGRYDDFESPSPFPKVDLVTHCEFLSMVAPKLKAVADRARRGEFDTTREEILARSSKLKDAQAEMERKLDSGEVA